MKSHRPSSLWIRVLLLVLLTSGLARSAAAQANYCWVGAGAAGALDPDDIGNASLLGPHLHVSDTAPLPVLVGSRHNVTGIYEANSTSTSVKTLIVRYRDNGSQARVMVYLKQVSLIDGAVSDLAIFDSDGPGRAQSSNFQSVSVPMPCVLGGAFHFLDYLYFLRVELTKTGSGGLPSLHSIQVCGFPCIP